MKPFSAPRTVHTPLVILAAAFWIGACGNQTVGDPLAEESTVTLGETPAGEDGKADSLASGVPRLILPLVDDDHQALALHNPQLKAAGMKTFPNYIAVSGTDQSRESFSRWGEYVDEVYEKLALSIEMMRYTTPADYYGTNGKKTLRLCYAGDPLKIAAVTQYLTDNVFSDQYILWGWRYKQVQALDEYLTEEYDTKEEAEQAAATAFPAIWKEWRGTGEAILLVYTINDGGDAYETAIVPKCI